MDNIIPPPFDFQEVKRVYNNIFDLTSFDCKVIGLKLIQKKKRHNGKSTYYDFWAIVKASCYEVEDINPSNNQMIQLKNERQDDVKGPEILCKIKYNDLKNNKVKSFKICGQITKDNIISWEIKDGFYYIKCELFGFFG